MEKNRGLSGWLNIYKKSGITSYDVIRRLKTLLKKTKIGHAGTLDPLAEGVLPIALGHATKTISFMQNALKTYECEILWGVQTDTDDITGTFINKSNYIPSLVEIERKIIEFRGVIYQKPPIYSALKVGGVRSYKLARKGSVPELSERKVYVKNIQVIQKSSTQPVPFTKLRITCGKGTYIRSIARDLGTGLGTYGTIKTLKRTAVGRFNESNSIDIFSYGEKKGIMPYVLPIDYVLDDIPAYSLDKNELQQIAFGQSVKNTTEGCVILFYRGNAVAIGQGDGSEIHPKRLLIGVDDVDDKS